MVFLREDNVAFRRKIIILRIELIVNGHFVRNDF